MSGSKVTNPRILSGTTEKVAIWLRERYGVTGEVPWQEESTAIRNRWYEDAEEFLQCIGVTHAASNPDDAPRLPSAPRPVDADEDTRVYEGEVVPPKPVRSAVGMTSRHRMGSARHEPDMTDEEYEEHTNPNGL